MAKSEDKDQGLEVVEVVHPGNDADAEFIKDQNEKLAEYRLTGVNRGYIDPTRDQEPDIAPEFGVSPHPEIFNPAPPAASFSGRALDESKVPMVQDVETKEENAKEATEAFNEALQAREELFQATKDVPYSAPVQPVYIVDGPQESDAKGSAGPVGDESLALVQSANPASAADAQLPQDLEAAGVVEADESDDSKQS